MTIERDVPSKTSFCLNLSASQCSPHTLSFSSRNEGATMSHGTSLPISEHEDRRERLRKERRDEYQQMLASKRQKGSSITEARRKLAEARDLELMEGQRRVDFSDKPLTSERFERPAPANREETYKELKERKRREEKRYRAGLMDYSPESISPHPRTVTFANQESPERDRTSRRKWTENAVHFPQPQHWDDEEDQYLQWARERGRFGSRGNGRRTNTPPSKLSNLKDDDAMSRSRSAPSVRSPDFMNLGKRLSEEEQIAKKRAYAEELRKQMLEKDKEKALERAEKFGHLKSKMDGKNTLEDDRNIRDSKNWSDRKTNEISEGKERRQHRLRDLSPPSRHSSMMEEPRKSISEDKRFHPHAIPQGWNDSTHHPPPQAGYPLPGYMPQPLPYAPHPYSYYYPPPPQPAVPLIPPPHPYTYYGQYDGQYGRPRSPPKRQSVVRIVTEDENDRSVVLQEPAHKHLSNSPVPGSLLNVSPQGVMDKDAYRAELERQIQEKKQRQLQDHAKREELDRKWDAKNEVYDPWGRGGCGAPIRDAAGKPITDLRRMRRVNESKTSPRNSSEMDLHNSLDEYMQKRDPSRLGSHTPHQAELLPPSDPDPKSQQEEYRMELKRQMEEKEELKRKEKEKQQQEEEREAQRLEMERKKLQEDYEREQQIQKQKEEETKAKNELLKKAAEEKRLAAVYLAKEKEEKERQELEMAVRRENEQRYIRPPSPPVPAVKNQLIQQGHLIPASHDSGVPPPMSTDPLTVGRGASPPVPALRNKSTTKGDFNHAEHVQMIQPLHHEPTNVVPRSKVSDLPMQTLNRTEPPKHFEQPTAVPTVQPLAQGVQRDSDKERTQSMQGDDQNVLYKLSAMRKLLSDAKSRVPTLSPSSVVEEKKSSERSLLDPVKVDVRKLSSRSQPDARPRPDQGNAIEAFNQLKYSNVDSMRKNFLTKFPEPPQSESALEIQQAELLKHQEEILSKLQLAVKQRVEPNKENQPQSSGGLLPSETVYVENGSHDTAQQQKRRKQKRRTWQISAKFGSEMESHRTHHSQRPKSQISTTSFDVDAVAEKNKDRLQKLDAVLRSTKTIPSSTPDDVIQHFLDSRTPYTPELNESEPLSRMSERSLPNETTFKPIFP